MTSGETRSTVELEPSVNFYIKEIGPLNYGNTDATISYANKVASGEFNGEVIAKSREIIQDCEALKPVTDSDDGCIDGREAEEVLYVDENGNFYTKLIEDPKEHIREKVAGGGYITGYAMHIGIGNKGVSMEKDMREVGKKTKKHNLCCGAHTGAHAGEHTTDCGANDKIDPILGNAVKFRKQIADNIEAIFEFGGLEFDGNILDRVIDYWDAALKDTQYFKASNGQDRFNSIQENIKDVQVASGEQKAVSVSKNLAGDHNEAFIVVNFAEGYTFSQAHIAELLAEQFPDIPKEKLPQVFVVDVPRIVKLADAMGDGDNQKTQEALYAGVAYQLATAATLTDGTLPVFLIK